MILEVIYKRNLKSLVASKVKRGLYMLIESHCIIVVSPVIRLLVTLFLRVIGRLIDHGLFTLIVTLIKGLLSVVVCVFKIGLRRILILV